MYRKVVFYKDYCLNFIDEQSEKVRLKFFWTIRLIERIERVPEIYLKHIEETEGLYEMRVHVGNDAIRIFCFFDKGQLVIIINGFKKKSQKTPAKEIELALKIKKDYETEQEFNDGR